MYEQELFEEIGGQFTSALKGNLFGKECYKIDGKPFVCFFQNCMIFKLSGETHAEALNLDGSCLFDPSSKGRPMKEWVQVPFTYNEKWKLFAEKALEYVSSLKK